MSLSNEQLRKIEENKRAALLKRQQGQSTLQNKNFSLQPKTISVPSNKLNVPFTKNIQKTIASPKTINAAFALLSEERFTVDMDYYEPAIEIMKTINSRSYDKDRKRWTFPMTEHDTLASRMSVLKPQVTVSQLPRIVVNTFIAPVPNTNVDISKIDPDLLRMLLPFQIEGVKFGISRKGRCLIADDMGLGKTIQALAIAHYYIDKWPLLIVCPSSMRFPWEEAIHTFLPSVNPFSVMVMTTGDDVIHEAKVVISSYDLLKSCLNEIKKKKFGVLIFDESHFLKSARSARSRAALELAPRAHHVILLSGTPALSRPQELHPQIHAIDPNCFKMFHEFGLRYCDGKQTRYGWNYSGSSNSTELDLLLRRKFLLRRLKSEVLNQLPSKLRKVIVLQPRLVKAVSKQMHEFATQMERQRGMDKRGTLLQYYCATGSAKLPAVKEYLEDKLECPGKLLIFAHHVHVLDGLCDLLIDKRIDHIRIDGSTSAEARAQFCERFQTDESTRVAVLSIKAANSGITLTAAQLVLFAELYWNPGELTQAEDRAHRIGQQDSVVVEYLIAKGTADDHLWSLVESKLNVLKSVGLSKDTFKNADTKHQNDKLQPTVLDMFTTADNQSVSNGTSTGNINKEDTDSTDLIFDSEEIFGEDDIFDNLDLESIESDCKKPKLS